MWNQRRSVRLSAWATIAMIVLMGLTAAVLPFLLLGLGDLGEEGDRYQAIIPDGQGPLILAVFYCFCVPALVALASTYRILANIRVGAVFDASNVRLLRRISWAALAGGAICVAATPISIAIGAVGLVCGFVGVILRVVKNLIAAAVELKTENDLTI